MELCDYPAQKIVELVTSQQATAVDVVNSVYKRIEQVEGRTGAVDVEEVPADAEKVHAFISLTKVFSILSPISALPPGTLQTLNRGHRKIRNFPSFSIKALQII